MALDIKDVEFCDITENGFILLWYEKLLQVMKFQKLRVTIMDITNAWKVSKDFDRFLPYPTLTRRFTVQKPKRFLNSLANLIDYYSYKFDNSFDNKWL